VSRTNKQIEANQTIDPGKTGTGNIVFCEEFAHFYLRGDATGLCCDWVLFRVSGLISPYLDVEIRTDKIGLAFLLYRGDFL
jgi:hypothetical protein